jgi:DNA-binding transcriptional MerR regulator
LTSNQAEYSINELAQKANVSVRTVRFYINEGLLPAPATRGRYTVYNDEYLDRLELIRRLKDAFLPLKEIRHTVTPLSWQEVQAALADLRKRESENLMESSLPAPSGRRIEERKSSALDYITGLLSSPPVSRPLPPRQAAPAPSADMDFSLSPDQEAWRRVRLAPGIEIHLRQPLPPEDQVKVEEILRLAKKLFPPGQK